MNPGIVACRLLLCALTLTLSSASLVSARVSDSGTTPQSGETPSSPKPATAPDDAWHVGITPYLWLAGMHGTVGAKGFEASVHASFSDIFSSLNIGLMGEVEARKKRVLVATDFMWMRLSDDKALPVNRVGLESVDVRGEAVSHDSHCRLPSS